MTHSSAFRRQLIAATIIILIFGAVAAIMMPWIKTLYDPALRESFTGFVSSLGIWGYALMFGIQVLQVVVAIIPGEPVELMAGALYGGLGGLVLCAAGAIAGTALIFALMRIFGSELLGHIFRRKKLQEYGFMQDARKLDAAVLLLFLLPGTPKDMLTYIAGASGMSMARFMIISVFARIPSVVTSTFIGDSVLTGNWYAALGLILATLALGLLGIFCHGPAMDFCRKHARRHRQNHSAAAKAR